MELILPVGWAQTLWQWLLHEPWCQWAGLNLLSATPHSRELLQSVCRWYGLALGVCHNSTPAMILPPPSLAPLAEMNCRFLWPFSSISAGFHELTLLFRGSF